jgi:enamine deaminase RidA (YjgF/YER057c/UK114 family)
MTTSTHGQVQYINPDDLSKNPAFTQVVTVSGPGKTIYIGGQDAVDASGTIVGKGDIKAQVEQVFKNLQMKYPNRYGVAVRTRRRSP